MEWLGAWGQQIGEVGEFLLEFGGVFWGVLLGDASGGLGFLLIGGFLKFWLLVLGKLVILYHFLFVIACAI